MKRIMPKVSVALILFAAASSTWSAGPSDISQTTDVRGAVELSNLAEDSPNEGVAEPQSGTVGGSSVSNVLGGRAARIDDRSSAAPRATREVAADTEKKKDLDSDVTDTTSMSSGPNYGVSSISSRAPTPAVPNPRGAADALASPKVPMPLAADSLGQPPSPADQMPGRVVPNAPALSQVPMPLAADSVGQPPLPVDQIGVGPNPRPGTDMAVPSKVDVASSTLQERYRNRMLELANGQAPATSATQENPAVIRRYLMVDRGTYQSRGGR
jgi:hypothetical protein